MVGSSTLAMPPQRSNLTSSFSVTTDTNNEVVCPLRNQDGSACRKRCLGEKRYRSMQEHIRRAHPEHYISKLPATEESFQLMITTPPSERPAPPQTQTQTSARPAPRGYDRTPYDSASAPNTPRNTAYAPLMQPAANTAAAALAQMHNKIEPDWDSEPDWHSDTDYPPRSMLSSIELPPLRRSNIDPTSDPYNPLNPRPRGHLSTLLSRSPPGRSATLPPIQRHPPNRPRKHSVSKRAREPPPHHRRQKSRESQLQSHMRRMSYERNAYSAEPSSGQAAYGKRWEDLIDAATSATSDVNEDRTPVPQSPQIPHSPLSAPRSSLPPTSGPSQPHFHYQASPLQQALTPPAHSGDGVGGGGSAHPLAFPSVEAGDPFSSGGELQLSDSSSLGGGPESGKRGADRRAGGGGSANVQIYCAACQGVSALRESYACTECVCGICQMCVDVLMAEQGARRRCPRCACVGGRFKPFQLDVR